MRPYERFMMDYAREHRSDELQYMNFDEDVDMYEDANSVYKENYYFAEHLVKPIIHPVLAKESGRDAVVDFVGAFLDSHSAQLSTSGPVYTFTFGEKEIRPLYELFNVNGEQLVNIFNEMVEETYYGKISKFFVGWIVKAPHKLLLDAMVADGLQNGYDDIVTCCEYMWGFTEYPILYREYWRTGVREDLMSYTIEHLNSKFKLKQHGLKNLKELLKYDATKCVEKHSADMTKGVDNGYNDLNYRMRNQFNSTLKNISREYYKNAETNATQHTDVNEFEDGQIADQDGHSSRSAQIISATTEKMSYSEINSSMLQIAADGSKVDKSNLSGYIGLIYSDKTNNLPRFIELIIEEYFKKYPGNGEISAGEFLNFALSLYKSLGGSKDERYKELRGIIDHWMDDIINIRGSYSSESTIASYSRGVYNYFVLMINYYQ